MNIRFRLRFCAAITPFLFPLVFVSVFVFGVSASVFAFGKKFENKCGNTQFRPFPLRFHP